MKPGRKRSLSFDTLRLEGAPFLPDTLEKAARGDLNETQSTQAYQIPKGITLQDEYGRAFQIAQGSGTRKKSAFQLVQELLNTLSMRLAKAARAAELHVECRHCK